MSEREARKPEPVLSATAVSGAVLAVLTLLGIALTPIQADALETIIAAIVVLVVPIIAGYVARKKVTPVNNRR